MHIVSYRGPGKAGGVSSTLACLWNDRRGEQTSWWYLQDSGLYRRSSETRFAYQATSLPQPLVDGHYRYCNDYLWPVMHDMPGEALYSAGDRELYRQFNRALARQIGRFAGEARKPYFVQDYQLALVPALLDRVFQLRSLVFWHIPWPASVRQIDVPAVAELARSLLRAEAIGFHTREYADNFQAFVCDHLGPQSCLIDSGRVELVVAPLGIDIDTWEKRSRRQADIFADPRFAGLAGRKLVLSVDRGDYTKGVLQRLQAIDHLFELDPQLLRHATFVQICGRTRPGLAAFDRYWQSCREAARKLNARWSCDSWAPLIWIDEPVDPRDLAILYRQASAMLVNPLRDGLNLTAKEFVACQSEDPGTLLLSRGAGVWHELGPYAVEVEPASPEQTARAVKAALLASRAERGERVRLMKEALAGNTLQDWWSTLSAVHESRERRLAVRRLYTARYSSAIRSLPKS